MTCWETWWSGQESAVLSSVCPLCAYVISNFLLFVNSIIATWLGYHYGHLQSHWICKSCKRITLNSLYNQSTLFWNIFFWGDYIRCVYCAQPGLSDIRQVTSGQLMLHKLQKCCKRQAGAQRDCHLKKTINSLPQITFVKIHNGRAKPNYLNSFLNLGNTASVCVFWVFFMVINTLAPYWPQLRACLNGEKWTRLRRTDSVFFQLIVRLYVYVFYRSKSTKHYVIRWFMLHKYRCVFTLWWSNSAIWESLSHKGWRRELEFGLSHGLFLN